MPGLSAGRRALILCDGGRATAAACLFKAELRRFAGRTGRSCGWPLSALQVEMQSIEHRMFPHVDRTYRGVIRNRGNAPQRSAASTAGGLGDRHDPADCV
jgi:hypothetical protein